MSRTPACLQAAMMASQSSTEVAIGFSQITCLPAPAAAMQCCAWRLFGVTT